MNDYLTILLRIFTILPLLLILTIYIMGKRSIGELPVFDFLIIIILGSVVGADIADPNINHMPTAFAVAVLAIFQFIMSTLIIKKRWFGRLASFEPTLIIQDGIFLVNNMRRIKYSIDEVLMMLREKDVFDFSIVQFGIIESNGKITVLKKPEEVPLKPSHMNIPGKSEDLPIVIVLEGKVDKNSIKLNNLTEEWAKETLRSNGYNNIKDIFIASYTKEKGLVVSTYNQNQNIRTIGH
ncbi:DUF421 domain-containing protein [Serpentinicella alkaliphila]|uniref:Uncharacterized membrane protein YcaP (DUF421 family) n=1 Tax=Serpentinicella alkaliphila TaxID=1734049 RepID=A0A4R2TGV9_9FIRM|nr:DUF421 domain-containing protein [Serpentinicella alkaliphila]QUH25313.1 DUF421 domain-containing protein [Serpentinicella alkaliphila]TCQ02401.1 uncharacterized membrane protein YcaP (DUF421 family) [Serpentinicella alkaliphila]